GPDKGPDLKRIRDELRQRQALRRGARVAEELESRGVDVDDDAVLGDQRGVPDLFEELRVTRRGADDVALRDHAVADVAPRHGNVAAGGKADPRDRAFAAGRGEQRDVA